jgi:hypothetical protein
MRAYGTAMIPAVASLPSAGNAGNLVQYSGHAYHDNGSSWDDLTTPTIPAASVTLAMQANVASGTVFYRKTAGSGAPEVQTLATLKTDLGFPVDLSGSDATGILAAARHPALSGDISTPSGSIVTTIGAGKVTFAMLNTGAWSDDTTLASDSSTLIPTQHAVKAYADNLIAGLKFKVDCRVASTANVTISGPGTAIDGVTLSNGDRVLLKNQSTGSQNGVYIFNGSGSAMTRATDGDAGSELVSATFPIREGTANADTWWTVTNDTITIGTTVLTFSQTAGAGTYTNGSGLTLTGNSFSIASSAITNAMLAGSIDLTTKVTGILPSANGGTENGFTKFTGASSTQKIYTLPNAACTILTDNAAVTGVQGGTGQTTYTKGDILASPGSNTLNKLAVGSDGQVLTADAASTNGVKWAAVSAPTILTSYLSSDFTNATTTPSNTALSVTVVSGGVYSFVLNFYANTSTSGEGCRIDVNGGSATFTNIIFGTPFAAGGVSTSAGNAQIMTLTQTFNCALIIIGTIEVNAGGTFIIRAWQDNHTSGTLTIKRDSSLRLTKMN